MQLVNLWHWWCEHSASKSLRKLYYGNTYDDTEMLVKSALKNVALKAGVLSFTQKEPLCVRVFTVTP